jgi:hypothetical protein
MNSTTVRKFADLFGKTKGAAVPGDPSIGAEAMNLHTTKDTEPAQHIDYTVASKDRGFEKKLRWQIQNPVAENVRWTITPEMAEVMLKWNDRNRALTLSKAETYAEIMMAGGWRYNGMPIIFSSQRLIDGQHRLSGCTKSGVSFDTLVVFGAPDDAFDTIDIGKTRTASDIFSIHGVKNASNCAAATRWIYGYENDTLLQAYVVPHSDLYEYFSDHKTIADSVWVAQLFAKNRLAPPSVLMGVHYVAARKSKKDADIFFRKVGEGLGFNGKKDPAYRLHHRFMESAMSQEKLGWRQISALTIKAWNAHRLGRDVGVLKFGADETFPKVI